jgi:hypothetical protein
MGFKRQILPIYEELGETLLSCYVGMGMNFSSKISKDPNIEDTVLAASIEGLEHDDLRVLSILTTWLGIHSSVLNVDRLTHIVSCCPKERVKAYWAAIAIWLSKDHRFKKIASLYDGPIIDLLRVGTDFQLKRRGVDKRFVGSSLRVVEGTLRDRASDVLTPPQLAHIHQIYKWRTIIGPTYRADMWAQLEKNPKLSTAELARITYGSFATAWKVKRDWSTVNSQENIVLLTH